MLSGRMANQMNEDPLFESGPGDSFFESPGCHHVKSYNIGDTEASFYATLILDQKVIDDEGYGSLVVVDAEVEEQERNKKSGGK